MPTLYPHEETLRAVFEQNLSAHLEFTSIGFGPLLRGSTKDEAYEIQRKILENSFEEFVLCVDHLLSIDREKIHHRNCGQRALDLAAVAGKPIPSGAMALAAIVLGFKVGPIGNTPNCYIELPDEED